MNRAKKMVVAVVVVLTAASLPGIADGAANQTGIAKGPYLQSLGSNDVVVKVELKSAMPLTLEVFAVGDAGKAIAPVKDPTAKTLHTFRLQGLEPQHSYRYHVRGESSVVSDDGQFTTAPKNETSAPFSFLLYGDNRTDADAHAAVVRAMNDVPSDFLVHTGDFVADGRDSSDWQKFFDIEHVLLRDRCVFACVGNHELLETAAENYLHYFGPSHSSELYSTFRWGDARFFLLNGSDTFTDGPEAAWLTQELTRADSEADLTWRFVVVHHGPWSAGPHGNNERLLAGNAATLFAAHKIDAVFSGHDHIYERGDKKGIRYIVTGGGGAPLYPAKSPLASSRKLESTFHFVEVNVTKDDIKTVARRPNGTIIERCGFGKSSGQGQTAIWDCDAPPLPVAGPVLEAATKTIDPPRPAGSKCGCRFVDAPGSSAPHLSLAAATMIALAFRRTRKARLADRS